MDVHSLYTVILGRSPSIVLLNQLMFVTLNIESVYAYEALDRDKVAIDQDDPMAVNHVFVLVQFKEAMLLGKAKKLIEQVPLNYLTIYKTVNPRDNGFAHRRIYRAKRVFDGIHVDDTAKGQKYPVKNLSSPPGLGRSP